MTPHADRPNGKPRASVDANTADRLLDGLVSPEDAPHGFAGVARVVIAARRPATSSEVAGAEQAVAAATRLLQTLAAGPHPPRPLIRPRRRFVRAKVAAVVLVGTVLGTSGLAAAGVLPEPLQNAAADLLDTVGIHVPHAGEDSAGRREEVSETTTATESSGAAKGAELSNPASDGKSHAGEGGVGRQVAPGQTKDHATGPSAGAENASDNGATNGRRGDGGEPVEGGTVSSDSSDGKSRGVASSGSASGEHARGDPPAGDSAPDHARND